MKAVRELDQARGGNAAAAAVFRRLSSRNIPAKEYRFKKDHFKGGWKQNSILEQTCVRSTGRTGSTEEVRLLRRTS